MKNVVGTLIAACVLAIATPGFASAAPRPSDAPSAKDLAEIATVVGGESTHKRLESTKFPAGAGVQSAAGASADAAKTVAVYEPTAAFITGKSAVPAALAYVAAPATIGDGTTATVWLQRAGNGWEVFNVASGDVENQFAARVSSGYLLHEPQANAWYAVDGDTVKVLDGGVTTAAEGTSMTLEQYRAMLNERYGDKLPGSTYDRTGAAGGYGPAATPTSEPTSEPASTLPVILFAGGAILIAGAGAFAFRRLRKN